MAFNQYTLADMALIQFIGGGVLNARAYSRLPDKQASTCHADPAKAITAARANSKSISMYSCDRRLLQNSSRLWICHATRSNQRS